MDSVFSPARSRYGVVLAGGDGRRLEPFVNRVRGDSLPKQYLTFVGSRSGFGVSSGGAGPVSCGAAGRGARRPGG